MKFREFIDVRDGTHSSPKSVKKGYHLVTTKNLKMNYIDFSKSNIISNTDFEKINRRSKVEQYDILLSMIGTVGNVYQERHKSINYAIKNIALLKFHGDELLSDWMNYFLQSMVGHNLITSRLSGSTQQFISLNDLRNLEIELPSRSKMKEIITPLMIIDRKMMSNKQINANLVELSNTIFKQILVSNDLHEFTINDIGTVAGGGTPSKKIISYWNGNIPWLSPKDLSNKPRIFTSSGENYITQQGLDNSSTKLLPRNTVLFSSRAPIGYLSIAKNRIATNQGFKSVIPNKQYPFWFIYELLKVETPRIINEANGSTFKEVSGSRLKQHIVYVPKSSDVLRYNSIFISLFQKMMQSESEIDTLNSLKRALLNKLF